jgi:hypothetical protein
MKYPLITTLPKFFLKTTNKKEKTFNSLTYKESYYSNSLLINSFKINTTLVTLNDINKFFKEKHCFIKFNFNIRENLNISNQQRWLTKNSLLTESIIPNSFLITQAKKLIGNNYLNKDLTKNVL